MYIHMFFMSKTFDIKSNIKLIQCPENETLIIYRSISPSINNPDIFLFFFCFFYRYNSPKIKRAGKQQEIW